MRHANKKFERARFDLNRQTCNKLGLVKEKNSKNHDNHDF